MKVWVKDLLSPKYTHILDSLHQLNPIQRLSLSEIEKQLISLRVKYRENENFATEIEFLLYKVKGCLKFTVIVEKKDNEGRGLHPIDLSKKKFTLKINNITKKGFQQSWGILLLLRCQ